MKLKERVKAVVALGHELRNMPAEHAMALCAGAQNNNGWFDEQSVLSAIAGVSTWMHEDVLLSVFDRYDSSFEPEFPKKVLVVMAGNIPLVGLHDALCVLLTGNILLAKLSANDSFLMEYVLGRLTSIAPEWQDYIQIHRAPTTNYDAVIATGSDNSARYFAQYFGRVPNIIRKNRTSLAVLTGQETEEELALLASDMLTYYGLGCRNVTKCFVPEAYDLKKLMAACAPLAATAMKNHKYANNYDYIKSIYLVNGQEHLDNGGLILKEDQGLGAPVCVCYIERYKDAAALHITLQNIKDRTQCIVSSPVPQSFGVAFGSAQSPSFTDFADGVDTIDFLCSLH